MWRNREMDETGKARRRGEMKMESEGIDFVVEIESRVKNKNLRSFTSF